MASASQSGEEAASEPESGAAAARQSWRLWAPRPRPNAPPEAFFAEAEDEASSPSSSSSGDGDDASGKRPSVANFPPLVRRIVIRLSGRKPEEEEELPPERRRSWRVRRTLGGREFPAPRRRADGGLLLVLRGQLDGLARYVRQRNAARASDPWGALRRPLDVVTGDLKGLYRWVHPVELTPEWDAERVEEYFQTRPLALAGRVAQISAVLSSAAVAVVFEDVMLSLTNPFDRQLQRVIRQATPLRDALGGGKEGDADADGEASEPLEPLSKEEYTAERQESTLEGRIRTRQAQVVRDACVRLGPTFVKAAQTLSARPDILPPEVTGVLAELQDSQEPFSTAAALATIREQLGCPTQDLFAELSNEPVAAASLGQVYKGKTLDGRTVAVKVQRPGSLRSVSTDVYLLRWGLKAIKEAASTRTDLPALADELGRALCGELNYRREAANGKAFAEAHRHLAFVTVPEPLDGLSADRVLTMEWIDGETIRDIGRDAASPDRTEEATSRLMGMINMGVAASLVQLLETGLLHADPHPGNLLLTPAGTLAYLDFGLLCKMRRDHSRAMLAALAHMANADWGPLTDDLAAMEVLPPWADRAEVARALEEALGTGGDGALSSGDDGLGSGSAAGEVGMPLRFGPVAAVLIQVALRFRFRLPPYFTLVLRSLTTLEGIALTADDDFRIFRAAYPYVLRRVVTDNCPETRSVLRQLLLTDRGELRWGRIEAFAREVERAQGALAARGISEAGGVLGSGSGGDAAAKPERKDALGDLFELLVSRRGAGLRRVLLEMDMTSLVRGSLRPRASYLRRRVVHKLARSAERAVMGGGGIEKDATAHASRARARARQRRLMLLARGALNRLPPSKMVWLQVTLLIGGVLADASAQLAAALLRSAVMRPLKRAAMRIRLGLGRTQAAGPEPACA